MASVSQYKLQEAVNEVAKLGLTKASISLGIASSTLGTRLKIAEREGIYPNDDTVSEIEAINLENKRSKNTITQLTSQVEKLQAQILDQDKVSKFIFNLRDTELTPPKWPLVSSFKKGVTGVPMTIWSDFHWGETVEPKQVHGINEYNMSIARRRFKTLVAKTISLCYENMANANYPGVVLMLGGDMISGDIHEELEITNEKPIGPVLIDLVQNLIWGIDKFIESFGNVWIIGVAGNHGRTHKKPRYKDRQFTNYDWITYKLLETHYVGNKNVNFYIPDGADAQFSVYNTNFFLTHGDNLGVKGGDGIIGLIGPVMRGDFKIRNAQSSIGKPYDVIVMGHWHNYMALSRIIINNCLKGFDEFAHLALRARPSAPSQALWVVHPEYGITCHWEVICDKMIVGHEFSADAPAFKVTGV